MSHWFIFLYGLMLFICSFTVIMRGNDYVSFYYFIFSFTSWIYVDSCSSSISSIHVLGWRLTDTSHTFWCLAGQQQILSAAHGLQPTSVRSPCYVSSCYHVHLCVVVLTPDYHRSTSLSFTEKLDIRILSPPSPLKKKLLLKELEALHTNNVVGQTVLIWPAFVVPQLWACSSSTWLDTFAIYTRFQGCRAILSKLWLLRFSGVLTQLIHKWHISNNSLLNSQCVIKLLQ